MRFRSSLNIAFARLPGFSRMRGHFVPERVSAAALDWARGLLDQEAQEEIQQVYQNAKDILDLRKKDLRKTLEKGGGAVESKWFRYAYFLRQNEQNPGELEVIREVELLAPKAEIPENLDLLFPHPMTELVLELKGFTFDELVERFEDLKDKHGGRSKENETTGLMEYTNGALRMEVHMERSELVVDAGLKGCLPLLKLAEEQISFFKEALPES